MDDLISRTVAIAEIEEFIEEYSELDPETGYHSLKWCAMEEAKDALTMLPAVDAVPVVRCRNCVYYNTACCADGFGWCERNGNGHPATDDFYCANGEQKNED